MRRVSYLPFFLLLLFYFCLFSLSQPTTERLRSLAICSFSPLWHTLDAFKKSLSRIMVQPLLVSQDTPQLQKKLEKLQVENTLLQSQLEHVREWLLSEDRVQEQLDRLKKINDKGIPNSEKDFFKRRCRELCQRLELHIQSIPAKVIFREPSSWSSALWINVGEKQNKRIGKKIIAKNSPVLFGTSIIGVVEYIGNTRSRVRLITDARLVPAVRAIRGEEQERFLIEHLEMLMFLLQRREDLFSSSQEAISTLAFLSQLKSKCALRKEDKYLAKGEIFGTSSPLWRSRSPVLKGIGFNYDCADDEGPSRDLRSGEPYDSRYKKEPLTLLRSGDLLITSGLDGIFPAGFRVATVSKVHMLKEGSSSYEIEAITTAGNLDEISDVIILPSLEERE